MLTALAVLTIFSGRSFAPTKPKLVVLISIDQFRADYIRRYESNFLPARSGGGVGGFRYLMDEGADYLDAHHNHVPTATGPGHATLMTGSEPCLDGIAGNEWYDRETSKSIYCVSDPSVRTVGGPSDPMSAKNLLVSTVGDELKLATDGQSKVVGISFKDRAAILMAGHAADNVFWLDGKSGDWVTSTYFQPNGQLPEYITRINSAQVPKKAIGKNWEPSLPLSDYENTRPAPFEHPEAKGGFSHPTSSLGDFTRSSFGQEYLFSSAEAVFDATHLGAHTHSDVMVINLATNDYVGHKWGPNSPKAMDITVRTDRLLSHFFNHINRTVGLKNAIIVVTADHGVVPIPEESRDVFRMPAERVLDADLVNSIESALQKSFGPGKYLAGSGIYDMNVYLDHALLNSRGIKLEDAEAVAVRGAMSNPNVAAAFSGDHLLKGTVPQWSWVPLVSNGFNERRSGDLMVFTRPGYYQGEGNGTGHSEPWDYDSHVPLLIAGAGIRPGRYMRKVHTSDIASTLSILLQIEYPTGNMGIPLKEALGDRS